MIGNHKDTNKYPINLLIINYLYNFFVVHTILFYPFLNSFLAFMILSALPSMAQIDLHSHAITKGYLDYIKANGAEMDEGFPLPAWDAEQHIAFMDKAGIQTAVLTMPAPQPWFGDAEASAAVCRSYNEECAALKARYPGRFMFGAALPLPDVPHALEEARYAL